VRDCDPFLRGARLSQLPSLGREPRWARWRYPSFRALGAVRTRPGLIAPKRPGSRTTPQLLLLGSPSQDKYVPLLLIGASSDAGPVHEAHCSRYPRTTTGIR
jgi:hypothetical protein